MTTDLWRRICIPLVLVLVGAGGAPAEEGPLTAERIAELEARFRELSRDVLPSSVAILGTVGMGSGVLIDESGLVLTNAHVALAAPYAAIVFPDGRRVVGRRIGVYFPRDLALYRLPPGDYPAIELGPDDRPAVGEWVAAYGHPGGLKPDLQPSFSIGRVMGEVGPVAVNGVLNYAGGVQTDLAIFSGNSGGPLIDLEGRLRGINGAVDPAAGASYSLSMEIVRSVLPRLKDEKIHLSDDLVLDPADSTLAPLFAAYHQFSRRIAQGWIERGWPGEAMESGEAPGGTFERWASDLLDRIDGSRGRRFHAPLWRGREAEARQRWLADSFAGSIGEGGGLGVRVESSGGDPICLGTVVAPGWIVTKASLLSGRGRSWRVTDAEGTSTSARRERVDEANDLALLRIEGADLAGPMGEGIEVGGWVVAPDGRGGVLAVGVLSAGVRPIPAMLSSLVPDAISRGMLWTLIRLLRQAPEGEGLSQLADQLEKLDRGRRIFESSNRPRAYPRVLQHDAPLDVHQMGGPLLDRRGRLVGVNVGRAHHGTTYAVPFSLVRESFPEPFESH